MNRLKEASPSRLHDRDERACAKLARIARGDTVFGGARAMVLVKRLVAMGSKLPVNAVVRDVYSLSNMTCGDWSAYECPECGSACWGKEAAYRCCSEQEGE